jgi:iron complex transport system ATP-binding protein
VHDGSSHIAGGCLDLFFRCSGVCVSSGKKAAYMILNIENVRFRYRAFPVLNGIELKINEHEIVSILGPNGVGKTTLLKCINTILKPYMGSVFIQEENVMELSKIKIAQKVGYVAQKNEASRTTVFDAVMLGRYPYIKWDITDQDLRIVNSIIHTLHLDDLALRFIDELSGGELQKVCTARALVQEPDILLLDEPTSNLDLKNQIEILELVDKVVAEHNVAAIMTMHDVNMALRYSDKLVLMKDGKVFSYCKKNDITANMIEQIYGVAVVIEHYDSIPIVIPREGK